MITWIEFARREAEMAESGRQLFYQFGGVGLGFLATIRKDGGPRLHPMCPVITDGGLFAMIIPSPKRRDLVWDGRYAMHSFPTDHNEDAFYITGLARPVADEEVATAVRNQFFSERPQMDRGQLLHDEPFEFLVGSALLTRTKGFGDVNPQHRVWRLIGTSEVRR